ncbi:hypothetical protein QFC19_002931 [Naganishia cerealis]|uniref:Uncharacterized protein n=1 Tax=Naganishia cerealis TaxID=610337 RepID=A0ACC2W6K5_9TREE|nr:hypothetical protein QFC19_002931 [Naganishia cerealis]
MLRNYQGDIANSGCAIQQQVMKITDGKGADIVYDPVGLLVPSLKCIAWKGRLLVVGFAAGQIEKVRFPSIEQEA